METDHACSTAPVMPLDVPLLRIKCSYSTLVYPTGPGVALWMHWLPEFKRTMPCSRRQCAWCRDGLVRRPLSYVPALVLRGISGVSEWRRTVIELPVRAAHALSELRLSVVSLRRPKPCGMVEIEPKDLVLQPTVSTSIDVFRTLFTLWRLPASFQVALVSEGYTD